ncbi:MAG: TolC family protein [Sphingobacteriales bacterium]|nr:TolC family protein [Sphingobacteriales bacterium]MBI3719371.1 TolC family protein [Sphingobacteriales bacterium]
MKSCVAILFFITSALTGFSQPNSLGYFLDKAKASSPLLKEYQNQLQLNAYDSLLIRAAYKPQVNGSSFNSYYPVIKGWGYDAAITNGANFATLIGVNKLLANKKNLAAQFENIQIQNLSVTNTSKITEQDLNRTIISQYITTYGDLLQLNFNKEIIAMLVKEEVILKKLTERNVYKQADYLAFLVTLQQQQLLVKQLNIQYNNDYLGLNYLSGIADTTTAELQAPAIQLKPLPDISNSAFFKKFEIDSMKLVNSRALVDITYRPKINLFADAGFFSSLATHVYKNVGTSFGVSAIIPIYDGKQRKLQYNKITIAEKNRTNYKDFFKTQYSQQIAQLTRQLQSTEELIADINNQLKYSSSLIDVNGKLLETGDVRIADYILALNNYLNAKNLITQNNINRLQIINQINYWNR